MPSYFLTNQQIGIPFFFDLSTASMSWSHPNLKFVFPRLSDLVPCLLKGVGVENAASAPPFYPYLTTAPPVSVPPLRLPVYWFGKAYDLRVQLPWRPVMVYFLSKCILVPLCLNFQDKFCSCATWTSHELTCLQCRAVIVCHTFQIKGSQDGRCLQNAGSCQGLRVAALSTGMVFEG